MKQQLFAALESLAGNDRNHVVHRDGGRVSTTWSELARDIDRAISRLASLRPEGRELQVGLIGPTSYEWMVLDLACLKAGFRSIAVPEFLTGREIAALFQEAKADVVLADRAVEARVAAVDVPVWFFGSGGSGTGSNFSDLTGVEWSCSADRMLDHYSIGYSSGTSGKAKRIDLKLLAEEPSKGWRRGLELAVQYYRFKTSFWSRKDNKLLIFMPFSHIQQRAFARLALMRGIDIVLSDSMRCVQDLVVEKPNVMVSVPMIYEALATRIEAKLRQMSPRQKAFHRLYLRLGINRLRNRSWVKRLFGRFLFGKVRKIYGGRADYFVTGSAPIGTRTLATFHRVGVKIYEGYGQSELPRIISMSSEKDFRIGSVGKPRVPVKIGEDGEIRVRIDRSELADPSIFTFDPDGYICTGDLGHIDEDGFLFLEGRKDDVIVLDSGKKVFPSSVETVFHRLKAEDSICVTSFDGKRIAAVAHWPADQGGDAALRDYLGQGNRDLAEHEKVKLFVRSDAPFTVENGMLTGTRKLRRQQIKSSFRDAKQERVDD